MAVQKKKEVPIADRRTMLLQSEVQRWNSIEIWDFDVWSSDAPFFYELLDVFDCMKRRYVKEKETALLQYVQSRTK